MNELLNMARTYAKIGVKMCKRTADDGYVMIGLSVQLDVMVMNSQINALQTEHLVVKPHIFRCEDSTHLDMRRHEKMEMIRREIEKVQRRINKEKNKGNVQPADVSILSPNPDIPQIQLPMALPTKNVVKSTPQPLPPQEDEECSVGEQSTSVGGRHSEPVLGKQQEQDIFDMQITM